MNQKERNSRMRQMVKEGRTLLEIATRFGLTKQRVHQIVGNVGYRPRYGSGSIQRTVQAHRTEMLALWEKEHSFSAIAKKFDVPPYSLGKYLGIQSHYGTPKHGTRNWYSYHGCRCDQCRQANRQAQHANYLRRRQRLAKSAEKARR